MKSNAPGQLLGYALQFPRALYHLLKCGPGEAVSVEVLGDVATLTLEGGVIAEEDKSSIVGNPITDRSIDLWKTFSNWIIAIKNDDLDVIKTKFVLYSNQSGREGIAAGFSSAQNRIEAQEVIDSAKEKLEDIKPGHDIWKYYDFVVNENEDLLLKVIERFELQIGSGVGYEEVRYELLKNRVVKSQLEFFLEVLGGWLQKEIMTKIAKREPAIIYWEDFNKQFLVQFTRAHSRELIDFTIQITYEDEIIQNLVQTHPIYLKQLEEVNVTDEEIIEAVSDYLRADVNREKWIESEIIDEFVAKEFEEKLKKYWRNRKKSIGLAYKNLNDDEQGQLLLAECQSKTVLIRNMNPPSSTIAGTYHALADETLLGWHPNWEEKFRVKDE